MDDDRRIDDTPWHEPGHHRVGIPRQRQPGEEVWRLRHPTDSRVQSCELRDDCGWDVTLLQDGKLLFSRRCVDERGATLRGAVAQAGHAADRLDGVDARVIFHRVAGSLEQLIRNQQGANLKRASRSSGAAPFQAEHVIPAAR
jgi:hypothetical protein